MCVLSFFIHNSSERIREIYKYNIKKIMKQDYKRDIKNNIIY